jgi:hypothetical protein
MSAVFASLPEAPGDLSHQSLFHSPQISPPPHEQLIPLSQVPKLSFIPKRKNGKRIHVSTIFRWAQRGIGGIQLQTWQVGGTKCTTIDALDHFFACGKTASAISGTPSTLTSLKRSKQINAACSQLDHLLSKKGTI